MSVPRTRARSCAGLRDLILGTATPAPEVPVTLPPRESRTRDTSACSSGGLHGEGHKPNILFIMSDDIGWFNVSAYNDGIMGYRTPNIHRIAKEGAMFTDFYGQQAARPVGPRSSWSGTDTNGPDEGRAAGGNGWLERGRRQQPLL